MQIQRKTGFWFRLVVLLGCSMIYNVTTLPFKAYDGNEPPNIDCSQLKSLGFGDSAASLCNLSKMSDKNNESEDSSDESTEDSSLDNRSNTSDTSNNDTDDDDGTGNWIHVKNTKDQASLQTFVYNIKYRPKIENNGGKLYEVVVNNHENKSNSVGEDVINVLNHNFFEQCIFFPDASDKAKQGILVYLPKNIIVTKDSLRILDSFEFRIGDKDSLSNAYLRLDGAEYYHPSAKESKPYKKGGKSEQQKTYEQIFSSKHPFKILFSPPSNEKRTLIIEKNGMGNFVYGYEMTLEDNSTETATNLHFPEFDYDNSRFILWKFSSVENGHQEVDGMQFPFKFDRPKFDEVNIQLTNSIRYLLSKIVSQYDASHGLKIFKRLNPNNFPALDKKVFLSDIHEWKYLSPGGDSTRVVFYRQLTKEEMSTGNNVDFAGRQLIGNGNGNYEAIVNANPIVAFRFTEENDLSHLETVITKGIFLKPVMEKGGDSKELQPAHTQSEEPSGFYVHLPIHLQIGPFMIENNTVYKLKYEANKVTPLSFLIDNIEYESSLTDTFMIASTIQQALLSGVASVAIFTEESVGKKHPSILLKVKQYGGEIQIRGGPKILAPAQITYMEGGKKKKEYTDNTETNQLTDVSLNDLELTGRYLFQNDKIVKINITPNTRKILEHLKVSRVSDFQNLKIETTK